MTLARAHDKNTKRWAFISTHLQTFRPGHAFHRLVEGIAEPELAKTLRPIHVLNRLVELLTQPQMLQSGRPP